MSEENIVHNPKGGMLKLHGSEVEIPTKRNYVGLKSDPFGTTTDPKHLFAASSANARSHSLFKQRTLDSQLSIAQFQFC